MSQNFNKGIVDQFPGIMDTVKRVNGGKIPGQVRYTCHLCTEKFNNRTGLDNHLWRDHGIQVGRCRFVAAKDIK